MICSYVIGFNYLILPLILKILTNKKEIIMFSYVFAIIVMITAVVYKSILYYKKSTKVFLITSIESIGIVIACLIEGYFNVYKGRQQTGVTTLYFFPSIVICVGSIPFLLFARDMIINMNKLINESDENNI